MQVGVRSILRKLILTVDESFLYIPRAPSIQTIPTLGPKVCKYDLLWAIWSPSPRACYTIL